MADDLIDVLVPVPLLEKFTYKLPKGLSKTKIKPGIRVRVPFGKRTVTGIFWNYFDSTKTKRPSYKLVKEILDEHPLLDQALLDLADWSSRYYHYPLGEVVQYFFPPSLRKGKAASFKESLNWKISNKGDFLNSSLLDRAPKQKEALNLLKEKGSLSTQSLKAYGVSSVTLNNLNVKGLVQKFSVELEPVSTQKEECDSKKKLTKEQDRSFKSISKGFGKNEIFLLHGVTGSGKTEIYLRCIKQLISRGQQALVLIPEIGLAPQVESRFKELFGNRVASFHSAKNERERLDVWLGAQRGIFDVVIGTRSSVFIPMKNLGMIVVDEEHDTSFKQYERFRYSARDIALYRGKLSEVPVILASATPSVESMNNALKGKYNLLSLTKRATGADLPTYIPLDLRGKILEEGFSSELITEIKDELLKGNQALIFLNRRGFASSLICKSCGWVSHCDRCDAHMTVHSNPSHLRCHHCEHKKPLQTSCPSCNHNKFESYGLGTERVERYLKNKFKDFPVYRIDSDSTSKKGVFKEILKIIKQGKPLILVGTQMLAKGHHFPDVTLVGILDADSGLFSADIRGSERVAQLITQVSGRAGREKKPGKVILQTYCKDHPQMEELLKGDYENFVKRIIQERSLSKSPPFSFQIKLQAESIKGLHSREFLETCLDHLSGNLRENNDIKYTGPLPSLMEKKSGLFRWEVSFFSSNRKSLHNLTDILQSFLYLPKQTRSVRWSIDVDPISTI
tara:strand:- start:11226 stop:13436 length:2211 start_codon:yes stop_codon:yes gene_type:complete